MQSSKKQDDRSSSSPTSSLSLSPTPLSPTPETFKKSQERWDSIASQFNLPLSSELTGLPPVVFPTFPTVQELAASAQLASPGTRPTGLFEELLQSRPEAIYIDILDHPEKFEDGVKELVEELVTHRRELTAQERELMDRAVLDFLAKPKGQPAPKPMPKKVDERAEMAEALDEELRAEIVEPPAAAAANNGEPPAFWWL